MRKKLFRPSVFASDNRENRRYTFDTLNRWSVGSKIKVTAVTNRWADRQRWLHYLPR